MLYILWRILMHQIQPSKHEKNQFIENIDSAYEDFKGSINADKYNIVYSTIRYIYRTYGFIFLRNYIFYILSRSLSRTANPGLSVEHSPGVR